MTSALLTFEEGDRTQLCGENGATRQEPNHTHTTCTINNGFIQRFSVSRAAYTHIKIKNIKKSIFIGWVTSRHHNPSHLSTYIN